MDNAVDTTERTLPAAEDRLGMPLVEAMQTQRAIRRMHPDPVDPWELETVRYHMLTATGTPMDGPLQRGVRAKISGDVSLPVAHGIGVIMSWFRQNIGI